MTDGEKLFCKQVLDDGTICGGVIDYDSGYNHLRCTKCGRVYKAMELAKSIENKTIIRGGESKMKVALCYEDGTEVMCGDTNDRMDTAPRLVSKRTKKSKVGHLRVQMPGAPEYKPEEIPEYVPVVKAYMPAPEKVEEVKEPEVHMVIPTERMLVEPSELVTLAQPDGPKLVAVESPISLIQENPIKSDEENSEQEIVEDEGNQFMKLDSYAAQIFRSADIDGDEDHSRMILCPIYSDGSYMVNEDDTVVAIEAIDERPLGEIAILSKKAVDQLESDLKKERFAITVKDGIISDKDKEIQALKNTIEKINKQLGDSEEKVMELEEELEDTTQRLKNVEYKLYYADNAPLPSHEPVAVAPPEEEEEEDDGEDDVEDEAEDDKYNQVQPAQPMQEMQFDVASKFLSADQPPVGSVPPKSVVKPGNRSAKYDPKFYAGNHKAFNKKNNKKR